MPYYVGDCRNYAAGDYYQGDYYQGDVFGFLKKAAKAVISVVPGPLGALARAVTKTRRGTVQIGPGPGPFAQPLIGLPPGAAPLTPLGPGLPIGTQEPMAAPGTAVANIPGRGLCIIDTRTGKRLGRMNKSTYVTRGGGTSRWPQQLMVHPAGTECVRSRRMNVANPRALRRAIRRAQGFSKLARRVLTFVSAKAPKGRAKFKKR